jgi:hypothetical protein
MLEPWGESLAPVGDAVRISIYGAEREAAGCDPSRVEGAERDSDPSGEELTAGHRIKFDPTGMESSDQFRRLQSGSMDVFEEKKQNRFQQLGFASRSREKRRVRLAWEWEDSGKLGEGFLKSPTLVKEKRFDWSISRRRFVSPRPPLGLSAPSP